MLLAAAALLCSACGQQLTCEDPQAYQASIEVEKVRSPDGLDALLEGKEMDIPRASPQDARPPGSPCLDLPPTIQSEAMREATRRRVSTDAETETETETDTGTGTGTETDAGAASDGDVDTDSTDDEPSEDGYGPPRPD